MSLNRRQLICLWVTGIVLVAMCLFPPWIGFQRGPKYTIRYRPVWSNPCSDLAYLVKDDTTWPPEVATDRLLLQCSAAVILGTLSTISLRGSRKAEPEDSLGHEND